MALRNFPLRLTTGAYILNSGASKLTLDSEGAQRLQAMAANVYPKLGELDSAEFGKLLAAGELALGGSLLLPFVPRLLAGLGLTGFSAALLWMYHKTEGLTVDGVRPTPAGQGMAKDVFMLGAGLSLVVDALTSRKR